MGRLDGKVAIITGSASGMGKTEVFLFAEEGAKVVVTDILEDKVKDIVSEVNTNGGEAIGFYHDVTSEKDWVRVVKDTIEQFGKIDILVNNAGIVNAASLLEDSVEQWQKTVDVNLTGTFLGMKHVIPNMIENNGGSIINISSITGLSGGLGGNSYSASKGAVRILSKGAAIDYAKQNIRVNSVHPGFIQTQMLENLISNKAIKKMFMGLTPLPRFGKPDDVARSVLFLASDESAYITGIELPVDGGYSAK
ncbi:SDR family NAD(P)-dependent oxidoreductase [Chengkuizengella sp. SCS-71B]|uniref:SDR family NAD(P)-dependent oxidoreductase n=1 Tax=Chengkuizengella sp. SCS-71B TaxID=3115290 RepID=UPI0032C23C1B